MLQKNLPRDTEVDKKKGFIPYSEDGIHLLKMQFQDFVRGYDGHPFKYWVETRDKIYRAVESGIKKKYTIKGLEVTSFAEIPTHNYPNSDKADEAGGYGIGNVTTKIIRYLFKSLESGNILEEYIWSPYMITDERRDEILEKKIEQLVNQGHPRTDIDVVNDGVVDGYLSYTYLNQYSYIYRRTTNSLVYGGLAIIRANKDFNSDGRLTDYNLVLIDTSTILNNKLTQIFISENAEDLGMELLENKHVTQSYILNTISKYPYTRYIDVTYKRKEYDEITNRQTFTPEQFEMKDGAILYVSHPTPSLTLSDIYREEIEPNLYDLPFLGYFGFYNCSDYEGFKTIWDSRQYSAYYKSYVTYRIDFSKSAYDHISALHDIFINNANVKLNFAHDVSAIDTGANSGHILYGGTYYDEWDEDDFTPEMFPFRVTSDGYIYAKEFIKLGTDESDPLPRVQIRPEHDDGLKLIDIQVNGEDKSFYMQKVTPLIIPEGIPIAKININGVETILYAPLSGVSSASNEEEEVETDV